MSGNIPKFELETLEPRLLLSADPVSVIADSEEMEMPGVVTVVSMDVQETSIQSNQADGDSLFDVETEALPSDETTIPEATETAEVQITDAPYEAPMDDLSLAQTSYEMADNVTEVLVTTLNAAQSPPLEAANLESPGAIPRPILIVPGIAGTFAAPGAEEAWYTQRGIAPEYLKVDPLAGFYNDIVATLENAAGYTLGDNLFEAAYDWRMAPGPAPDPNIAQNNRYDGVVSGLTEESLTDDVYEFGVDYLGYWMNKALDRWEELYGTRPTSVDLVTHSTGGLVGRTYIQSDAYPTVDTDSGLPTIENFFMVAVPNRGAPKAWNPLQNNFGSDIAYKIVLSKAMDRAYELYLDGEVITGADGDIFIPQGEDPMSPEEFIVAYVPTIQGLLATYEFLIPEGASLPQTANGTPFVNDWILDINDGLDFNFTVDDFANGTNLNGRDPNAWAADTGTTFVYYSDGSFVEPASYSGVAPDPWETVTTVRGFTGPQGGGDNITNFDEFYGHIPEANESWYLDETTSALGDGTVPTASSFEQFDRDPNGATRFEILKIVDPLLHEDDTINIDSISHTGIMSNRQLQEAILIALGMPYDANQISTDRANDIPELLAQVLSLQILDPAELLLEANWADFPSFAVNTGIREALSAASSGYAELDTRLVEALQDEGVVPVDQNPLEWSLPFTNQKMGDLFSFQAIFDTYIAQPVLQYLLENPDGGSQGLRDFIVNDLNINITPSEEFQIVAGEVAVGLVTLGDSALQAALGLGPESEDLLNEFLVEIPFEYTKTSDVPLDLGTYAGVRGFEIDANGTIQYTATVSGTLVVGYDMRPGLSANERPFFRMNEVVMSAEASASDLNAALNVGILGTDIVNGAVTTAAGINIGLSDSIKTARNSITKSKFQNNGSGFIGAVQVLDAAQPFASMEATLPISVSYPGLPVLSPVLSFSEDNIFDGETNLTTSGFGELIDFTSLSTASIEDAFETLVVTLDRIVDSPALQAAIPFVANTPLSTLLDLAALLDLKLVDQLRDDNGSLTFSNLQEFIALLNGSMNEVNAVSTFNYAPMNNHADAGGIYDSASKTLSFNIGYDYGFLLAEQNLDFGYDLSPLEVFVGGGELTVGGTGSFSFDLSLGMDTPVASVKGSSPLPVDGILTEPVILPILLSGGALSNGQFVNIEVAVDGGNASASDLVDDINTALSASRLNGLVQARLDGGALVLETTFTGPFPSLAVGVSSALGFDDTAYNTYQPSAFADLSNLSASLNAGLNATQFTAGARVGYVGIFVNEGSANLDLDFNVDFLPGGPQAIRDLFLQVAGDPGSILPNISVAGSGAILLEDITVDGGFIADPGAGAAIAITLAAGASYPVDPADGTQIDVQFIGDFGDMLTFETLDFATMVQMFRDGLVILQDLTQSDFLNQPIPFIGGSVNDVLTAAEDFASFLDELEQNAPATIQALAEQLTFLIQDLLDEAFPGEALQPQVLVSYGANNVLTLDMTFLAHAGLDLKFELDPGSALPGLDKIIDLRGESMIQATLNAWIQLVFGIDLTDPSNPTTALYDGTEALFEILLAAENINFTAAAPLGFFVRGGSVRIDDGTVDRSPASASFAFDSSGAGSLALGSVSLTDFNFSVIGQASADLPIRFPTEASPVLPDHLTFSVDFNDLGNPTFNGPDFQQLFDSLNLFDSLADGLDLLFFAFEEVADGDIFGFEIPFIGDQLAEAATFILDLRQQIEAIFDSATTYTESQIQTLLFNALGPDGLDFLLPDGSGLPTGLETASLTDVDVSIGPDISNPDSIEIGMRLGQLVDLLGIDIAFADGLPGLNIGFDTTMEITMAWEWNLIFGVNRTDGFYIKTGPDNEMTIHVDAGFPDTQLTGSIGFLGMTAQTRQGGEGAGLNLTAGVDVLSDPNGIVTLGTLTTAGFSSFDVTLDGSAVLDLEMSLGFANLSGEPVDALPSFLADFYFGWDFVSASTTGGGSLGSTPEVRFDNIRLDVGTFFSDFLRPIIETVAAYLEPLRPVVNFLSDELGFLSWDPIKDIFDQNNDGKVTVLDLADLFGGNISPTAYDFLDAVVMIFDILDAFNAGQTPGRGDNLTISLGNYDFTGMDLRDLDIEEGNFWAASNFTGSGTSIEDQFASLGGSAASIFAQTQTGTETTDDDGENEAGVFRFLLFQPENLIRMIMGQKVDFFTYTLPEITVDFTYSDSYVVFSPPVVKVRFGFTVGFSANMTFGYDSSGVIAYLEPEGEIRDLFGGFYVAVGDAVPPQLTLFGQIYGGASVGLGIADVAVDIGAGLVANFSLIDPGEGKLYFWQIANLVENRGLLPAIKCLFITEGEIYGFARLSVDVGPVTVFEVEVARVTFWQASGGGDSDCFNFLIPDRLEQFEDGRPNNDTRGFAADLGVAPGTHLRGASISTPGDLDYYRFELIKPEALEIVLDGHPDFAITLYDAAGMVIGAKSAGNDRKRLATSLLPAGEYFIAIEAPDSEAYAAYDLDIDPAASSATRVFYINSPTALPPDVHSFYSLAQGDDAFADAGLDPSRPAATLDHILSSYSLTPDDIILFDTGVYVDSLNISGAPTGMTLAGAPNERFGELPAEVTFGSQMEGSGSNPAGQVASTADLTMARFLFANSETGLWVSLSDGFHGTGMNFANNDLGLDIGDSDNVLLENNRFSSSGPIDTAMSATGTTGLIIRNTFMELLDQGIVLTNTIDTQVDILETAEVESAIVATGGSGLNLQSILLEGAEVTQTDTGELIYTGEGQTGISVDGHSGLVADGLDIRRYQTGLQLSTLATATVSNVSTIENGIGLRGWGMNDTTVSNSSFRTDPNSFAILIGLGGDPASPGSNLTLTSLDLGIMPPGDGLDDPLSVKVSVGDVTGFSASLIQLNGNFTGTNLTGATLTGSTVYNGFLRFNDSSDVTVSGNTIDETGGDYSRIHFDNVSAGLIEFNTIQKVPLEPGQELTGSVLGTGIELASSDNILVQNNIVTRIETGAEISGTPEDPASDSTLSLNTFESGNTGIFISNTDVSGIRLESNFITDQSQDGIHAIGYAEVVDNTVTQSGVGIRFEQDTPGLFLNTVQNNSIGITGGGYLGNDDRQADQHNYVTQNLVGILAEGDQSVGFNAVYQNGTGLQVTGDNVTAHHNIIYRNTDKDVEINGSEGTAFLNNTVYSTSTHAIHVTGNSANTDLRNNIVWSDGAGGTVLAVDFPSGDGLTSDYNNYYASGGAILFDWIKTFDDLLDWQIELGLDLNSIGTTRIDPALDKPSFVDLANNNLQVVDLTSTTINSGDPSFDFSNEPGPSAGPNGLRINQGAFGDTALAALSPSSYIRVLSPNYYLDYSESVARRIVWESFNLTGNVSLELIEDGVGKVADMTIVSIDNIPDQVLEQPASHGSYFWSPQMSGIAGNDAKRYFIRVVSAADPAIDDQNRETFSVPVTTNDFYVNDQSTTDDVFTSVVGDNRNTGKTPASPKAILFALLQNYALSANQTVHVDTGDYLHLRDVFLSSEDEFGNNEAFTLEGPSGDGTAVSFNRADPREGSAGLVFDNSSFGTVRNLTLQGGYKGIEARNNSVFLAFDNIILEDHTGIQLHIHDGADSATVDNVTIRSGAGQGIEVNANLQYLRNSLIDNHGGIGVSLINTGNALFEGNTVSNNTGGGIYVRNDVSSTQTVIGNADLSLNLGNVVHDNGGRQVEVRGNTLLTGNGIFQTDGEFTFGTGIGVYTWTTDVLNNIISGHGTGVYSYQGSTIEGNRIYANSVRGIGLAGYQTENVFSNIIYSSPIGVEEIRGQSNGNNFLRNNIIYDFTTAAFTTSSTNGFVFENNTVFGATGNGIVVRSSTNGTIVNNIFDIENGIAIDLDVPSQVGLNSDFNVFNLGAGATLGTWAGGPRVSLQDWRNVSFIDSDSLEADPLFVDADGADGISGYDSDVNDGRDDNFHLQSTVGSDHGGALAPVLDSVSSLPAYMPSSWVADASQSPAIDRGDDAYAFDLEPETNGNFINIGAYGNTEQASLSPAAYVLIMSPAGGETWPIEQTFNIEWRSQDFTGTADIFLMQEGVVDPVATIATATENDGIFDWTLTNTLSPDTNYKIQVVRGDAPSVSGESLESFAISEPISFYYVNDAVVDTGGFTSAPGDNTNNGLSAATPKASIRAILDTYDLGEGDVILVDAGNYLITTNILIEAEDSGVTIRGFKDPLQPTLETLLDRDNRAAGSYIFELNGVDSLTIEKITFIDAYHAIHAGADLAPNLTVRESRFINNEDAGIEVGSGNAGFLLEGSYFEGSGTYSTGNGRQQSGLVYGGWDAIIRGNDFFRNYSEGIYLYTSYTTGERSYLIENNTISDSNYGIRLGSYSENALIQDNTVFNTSQRAIEARASGTVVTQNEIYDNSTGIYVWSGATAIDNVLVYNNATGISVGSGSSAINNIVYDNSNGIYGNNAVRMEGNIAHGNTYGIRWNYNTILVGNVAHGNATGFFADGSIGSNSQWRAAMYNNLSYGNTDAAIRVLRTVGMPQIINNTFIQSGAGTTAVILDTAANITFQNNIVGIDEGLAMNISTNSQAGFTSDYNVFHLTNGASAFLWGDLTLDTQLDWFYNVSADAHSLFIDPLFVDPVAGDYHLAVGSPAIDAGNPDSNYPLEPEPSGNRINVGAYGNTSEATVSEDQSIQVLNPVFLDKLLQDGETTIDFISAGFLDYQSVAWFNAGNETFGRWVEVADRTGTERETVSSTIDLSQVTDPAPLEVYEEGYRTDYGPGSSMSLSFDMLPGDYIVRLHFVDTYYNASDRFDLEINGDLVLDDYSIFEAAGGRYIAIIEETPVTVAADGSVVIDITAVGNYGRITAVEFRRADISGLASPTYAVEVSYDDGATFTPIASGVTVDSRGYGSATWTPYQPTIGRTAQVRVISEDVPSVEGYSNKFLIANNGTSYYVNDGSTANDVYTTAIGDNANSGKDPGAPMASMEALLTVYSPVAGDTIYIDSGTYNLTRNIVLTAAQSGIRIVGATDASNPAAESIFDRNNYANTAFGIELQGTDDLTIEHLTIQNAYRGISAGNGQASNLTVRDSRFLFNQYQGIYVGTSNTNLTVENSYFEGNPGYGNGRQEQGILFGGFDGVFRGNELLNNYRAGIDVYGQSNQVNGHLIENNTITGGVDGIYARSWMNSVIIRHNTVSQTTDSGIEFAGNDSIASENIVFDNNIGIDVWSGATATNNVQVYNNSIGIQLRTGGIAIGNATYNNTEGIRVAAGGYALVEDNASYNNSIGFRFNHTSYLTGNVAYNNGGGFYADDLGSNSQFRGTIINNLAYDNTNYALRLENTRDTPKVFNNTFIHAGVGTNAVELDGSVNVQFRNNIVSADEATALNISASSQAGFTADYNVYHLISSTDAFVWGTHIYADHAEWYYNTWQDKHATFADPQFVDPAGGDFHLLAGSPAIDAGDPQWSYGLEPEPSGNRLNAGVYGNTTEASVSPAQTVTVLDPTFMDKPQQNGETTVRFHTSGFLDQQGVAWFNAGTSFIEGWAPITGATGKSNQSRTDVTVDTSGVAEPAPQEVYLESFQGTYGTATRLEMPLSLQPGDYILRLHFARIFGMSDYPFDIEVNGVMAVEDFRINQAAGGAYKAVVQEVAATVDGSGIVTVALVATNGYARINAIEAVRVYAGGAGDPRFNIDASFDNGSNFAPIISGIGLNSKGIGTAIWLPEIATSLPETVLKVVNQADAGQFGLSDPFMVVNDGNRYYVNAILDGNDIFTTASGDNLNNTGKDPNSPMASLEALFSVHAPGVGDTVYVDSDTYLLSRNVLLGLDNTGVTILGALDPDNAAAETILDRNNLLSPSYAFEFVGADNVTLDSLTITNGYRGIQVSESSGENLTLRNSRITFNQDMGLAVGRYNPGLTVENSYFEGKTNFNSSGWQEYGISTSSTNLVVRDSTFINHYRGGLNINDSLVANPQALVENSLFEGGSAGNGIMNVNEEFTAIIGTTFANSTHDGLYLNAANSSVRDSVAYGNGGWGLNIRGGSTTVAENNVAYDNYRGIYGYTGTRILNNTVYDNVGGIYLYDRAHAEGNRVFGNSSYGLQGAFEATITGNFAYNNGVGIIADRNDGRFAFDGEISNNLVYSNGSVGISVESGVGKFSLVNNTIYHPTGDALLLRGVSGGDILNNIIQVDAGFAINIDAASQANTFDLDYNLFRLSPDPNARIGILDGAFADTLADWQTLTGRDANSFTGDPLFFDIDGADDVLGYREVGGILINGGDDDNYHLLKNSPAIDAGATWWTIGQDLEGDERRDDPGTPDTGDNRYDINVLGTSLFDGARGVGQGWHNNGGIYTVALPFNFSYFGAEYSQLQVSTYGVIGFPTLGWVPTTNTQSEIISKTSMTALWDNLDTRSGSGRDIYVDTSVAGEVYIRFEAYNRNDGSLIQFAYLLKDDGTIRFDYGAGNTGLSPTVGISAGNGIDYHFIDGNDGASDLANAPSVEFTLVPGLTDIGAYEFKGDSLDAQPPVTIGTLPLEVENELSYFGFLEEIQVQLSEAIDSIDVRSPATYVLIRDADDDGLFTDADEFFTLVPSFESGTNTVILAIEEGVLPDGNYQFFIQAVNLRDVSGNQLDGDGSGTAGGNYLREFSVVQPVLPVFTSSDSAGGIENDTFSFQVTALESPTSFAATGLPAGLEIDSATGLISGTPLQDGEFIVTLSATNSDGTAESDLTLTILPVPQVSAIIFNNGSTQRSMLQRIDIVIDQDISASLAAVDVRIKDLDTNLLIDTTQVQLTWSFLTKTLSLSFPGLSGGSLQDGNYQVLIESGALSSQGVELDGDNDGVQGGVFSFDFHRYFGDSTGNRTVDTLDGYNFRGSYNSSFGSPAYREGFDVNSDGVIDLIDRTAFEANFRQTLTLPPESLMESAEPAAIEPTVRGSSDFSTSSRTRHPYRSLVGGDTSVEDTPVDGISKSPQSGASLIFSGSSVHFSDRHSFVWKTRSFSFFNSITLSIDEDMDEREQEDSLYDGIGLQDNLYNDFNTKGDLFL